MKWIGHDLNMYTLSYTNITFAGLHASDDLAFNRDFEAVHTASRRLMNNGNTRSNNGPNAPGSVAYPDILNGGNRYNTPRSELIWRSTGIFMHLHLYKYFIFLTFISCSHKCFILWKSKIAPSEMILTQARVHSTNAFQRSHTYFLIYSIHNTRFLDIEFYFLQSSNHWPKIWIL